MALVLDNVQNIADALDLIEAKAGGTIADRVEARAYIREVVLAMRNDMHGFGRHLDVVEHAFRGGLAAGNAGVPATGTAASQAFFDYEMKRRVELGLPLP